MQLVSCAYPTQEASVCQHRCQPRSTHRSQGNKRLPLLLRPDTVLRPRLVRRVDLLLELRRPKIALAHAQLAASKAANDTLQDLSTSAGQLPRIPLTRVEHPFGQNGV